MVISTTISFFRSSSPTNPNVYYDIVHGSQEQANKFRTFVIDEDGAGGAIIKYGGSRPLDYEKIKEYTLTVRAMVSQCVAFCPCRRQSRKLGPICAPVGDIAKAEPVAAWPAASAVVAPGR